LHLSRLLDNDEENYKIFKRFLCKCSSMLLCIIHSLGHCDDNETLVEIILRLEVRLYFEHEEDDVGGHIVDFMRRIQNRKERDRQN